LTPIGEHTVSYSTLFFDTAPAPTEIYTLSLHDALPIWPATDAVQESDHPHDRPAPGPMFSTGRQSSRSPGGPRAGSRRQSPSPRDRKSTRLNSSHDQISYAVFCLKKKKKKK